MTKMNILVLKEKRDECCTKLERATAKLYVQKFLEIYQDVKKKNKRQRHLLREYQHALRDISEWSSQDIRAEHQRFKDNCDVFDGLVKSIFKLHMSIYNTMNESDFEAAIPTAGEYLRETYLGIARRVWKDPFLVYDVGVPKQEYNRSLLKLDKIARKCLLETFVAMLPFKEFDERLMQEEEDSEKEDDDWEDIDCDEECEEDPEDEECEEDSEEEEYDEDTEGEEEEHCDAEHISREQSNDEASDEENAPVSLSPGDSDVEMNECEASTKELIHPIAPAAASEPREASAVAFDHQEAPSSSEVCEEQEAPDECDAPREPETIDCDDAEPVTLQPVASHAQVKCVDFGKKPEEVNEVEMCEETPKRSVKFDSSVKVVNIENDGIPRRKTLSERKRLVKEKIKRRGFPDFAAPADSFF